jgi:1,2-phenylacetyl-CoA epoxidase catalytic subunit
VESSHVGPVAARRRKEAVPTYASRAEMDERMFSTVKQMMESQAYRELAAAQLFGAGLQYVPSLRWLKFMTWHIREEMEHYEAVVKMYERLVGQSVEPIVNRRLAERPIEFAASWLELAMAQFLYDRGGFWQLKEYEECSFLPYREVIGKIIEEEAGHQGLGERIVVELCRAGADAGEKRRCFAKWLRLGLLSFGRPRTEGNAYAMAVGLKKHDSGAVMQLFLDDIKPAVKACGLTFPTPAELRLEMPADIDFSLDGADERRAQGYA